ncbi:hypothetical protein J2Y69_000708 [Microbacterium resistens]|uniref:SPOR domain-containing protein n=1 Tax=Microbacterium resistens TaxID=156977 RepID=A0ABU1SB20_9MICO|nr:SPOR domain-containing protein [Microbacterium resistens]MDR6866123.1 hypothetical protein [Microbacterium resistens]
MADDDNKYWFNLRTGEVEFGMLSPSADRVGPFDTADAAAKAPEKLEENSRAWAAADAEEDGWGAGSGSGSGA